ncbi:MAG: hypothetical protein ACREIP_10310, partial [Alphaproteobacteria bacterium]
MTHPLKPRAQARPKGGSFKPAISLCLLTMLAGPVAHAQETPALRGAVEENVLQAQNGRQTGTDAPAAGPSQPPADMGIPSPR